MGTENLNPITFEFLLSATMLCIVAVLWADRVKQKHNERLARQEAKNARRHPSQRRG